MAGLEGAHADEGYANTGGPKDGPVLTMMSKRLRALRKKFNRILQIEENKAQGKVVNKEQEDVLKTKIAIAALIDEYEKLRQPLLIAVREEVTEREKELMAASLERRDEEESVEGDKEGNQKAGSQDDEPEKDAAEGNIEQVLADLDEQATEFENGAVDPHDAEGLDSESRVESDDHGAESLSLASSLTDAQIGDLLKLLYFAQLFDVRAHGEAPAFVWTKVHERSSCLSYDFVTDDATTPLIEGDLDSLSIFGSLLTTRPPNETLSHKDALEKCVEHAKAWLSSSDNPVGELSISYSRLRERLNRILSSEYFTMTPEMQTVSQQTAAAAATAAGQYVTKVLVSESPVGVIGVDETTYYQEAPVPTQYYQPREYVPSVPLVVANGIPITASPLVALSNSPPYIPESMGGAVEMQFGAQDDTSQASSVTDNSPEQDQAHPVNVQVQQGQYPQGQHRNQGHMGGGIRGGYQNMREGRVGYGGGGRRGRGDFPNGRGNRGGRGGYPNGGGGQFYDQGPFYRGGGPRSHYRGGERRGARGGSMMYNNGQTNGPAQSAPPPPPAAAVTTGSA